MKTSQDRILTTHVGSLPRTEAVVALLERREQRRWRRNRRIRRDHPARRSRDVVKRQVEIGIDIVSDGETSKISYATYVKDRLTGFSDEGSTEPAKPHLDLRRFRTCGGRWRLLTGHTTLQAGVLHRPDRRPRPGALAARSRQHARAPSRLPAR